jgi:hypothetical protein
LSSDKTWIPATFRIDPVYEKEKVVFITPEIAETYATVRITMVYGGGRTRS